MPCVCRGGGGWRSSCCRMVQAACSGNSQNMALLDSGQVGAVCCSGFWCSSSSSSTGSAFQGADECAVQLSLSSAVLSAPLTAAGPVAADVQAESVQGGNSPLSPDRRLDLCYGRIHACVYVCGAGRQRKVAHFLLHFCVWACVRRAFQQKTAQSVAGSGCMRGDRSFCTRHRQLCST